MTAVSRGTRPQIIEATFSRPMMRASARTSRFWSSRSWNSSGIAADFSCWTSSASGSIRARRIGLAGGVDLAGDGAQRGFHRRPVGFLRGGKLEPFLDAGDLHVAEQRVGFLRLAAWRQASASAPAAGRRSAAAHVGRDAAMQRPGAATGSAVDGLAAAPPRPAHRSQPPACPAWLPCSRPGPGRAMRRPCSSRAPGTLSRPRMLVAAAPTTRKQVSAMIVITRVKQLSVSLADPITFPTNWELIKA